MKPTSTQYLQLIQNSSHEAHATWRQEITNTDLLLAILASGSVATRVCAIHGLTLGSARRAQQEAREDQLASVDARTAAIPRRNIRDAGFDSSQLALSTACEKTIKAKFSGNDYQCALAAHLLANDSDCQEIASLAGVDPEKLTTKLINARSEPFITRKKGTLQINLFLPARAVECFEIFTSQKFAQQNLSNSEKAAPKWKLIQPKVGFLTASWQSSENIDERFAGSFKEAEAGATAEISHVHANENLLRKVVNKISPVGIITLLNQAYYMADAVARPNPRIAAP